MPEFFLHWFYVDLVFLISVFVCVCDGVFLQDERKMLLNKRLDLDICKARLKRAHEAEREASVSFTQIF